MLIPINPLIFLIIPSIIFEELFEDCCRTFSDNLFANLIFALLFWLAILLILIFNRKKKSTTF